jgi:hypothetical protein
VPRLAVMGRAIQADDRNEFSKYMHQRRVVGVVSTLEEFEYLRSGRYGPGRSVAMPPLGSKLASPRPTSSDGGFPVSVRSLAFVMTTLFLNAAKEIGDSSCAFKFKVDCGLRSVAVRCYIFPTFPALTSCPLCAQLFLSCWLKLTCENIDLLTAYDP